MINRSSGAHRRFLGGISGGRLLHQGVICDKRLNYAMRLVPVGGVKNVR